MCVIPVTWQQAWQRWWSQSSSLKIGFAGPLKGLKDHKMASQEAEEEAGVVGDITRDPAGTFVYLKRLAAESIEVEVTLFVLRVRREMIVGVRKQARTRRWFTLKKAARRVQEPELQAHITNAKKLFAARP